tara:strand:+ start:1001 stop:1192 length:192 start_codon:yes stop_codon:yes gene_type:complete
MTTLKNTFTVKQGNETNVLQEKETSNGTKMWVMFTLKNGVEMKNTRVVLKRLDKESKKWFNVK